MSTLDDFINRARYFDEKGIEQDAGCNEAAAAGAQELRAALDAALSDLKEIQKKHGTDGLQVLECAECGERTAMNHAATCSKAAQATCAP